MIKRILAVVFAVSVALVALMSTASATPSIGLVTSCIGQPFVGACLAADVNGDGGVDADDALAVSGVHGFHSATNSNLQTISDCYHENIAGACLNADVNGDGVIDGTDVVAASGTSTGDTSGISHVSDCAGHDPATDPACANADLNHDGVIDQADLQVAIGSSPAVGADVAGLNACMGHPPVGDCAAADVNHDGVIDTTDLFLKMGVPAYSLSGSSSQSALVLSCLNHDPATDPNCANADLNHDGVIDQADNNLANGVSTTAIDSTSQLIASCAGHDPATDPACAAADVNGDGVIDTSDIASQNDLLSPYALSIQNCVGSLPAGPCINADLNRDGTIDSTDVAIASAGAAQSTVNAANLARACQGGNPADPACAGADVNGDGVIDSADIVSNGVSPTDRCVDLTQTMQRVPASTDANSNGEVSVLQEFLARYPDIYPAGSVTGFFGNLTEGAVQEWQTTHDVLPAANPGTAATTGYGVVGPDTRTSIRTASGCGTGTFVAPGTVIPTITVTSPNGGEIYELGDTVQIKWDSNYVGLSEYEVGIINDNTYEVLASNIPSNVHTYSWTIPPDQELHDNYRVTVSVKERGLFFVQDDSNSNFSIVKPSKLLVVQPNGGELVGVGVGTTYTIKWVDNGYDHWFDSWYAGSRVRIRLHNMTTGAYTTIVNSTPNDGSYTWDTSGVPLGTYKIAINANTSWLSFGRVLTDESDNTFRVVPKPVVTITAPNGGQTYNINTAHNITWTSSGLKAGANVRIWRVNDSGGWALLRNATPNDGIESITMPNNVDNYKIYISATGANTVTGQSVTDYSDNWFSVTDPLLLF